MFKQIYLDIKLYKDAFQRVPTPAIDISIILYLIDKYKPETFLEVGTCSGHTSRTITNVFPNLKITTCDPGDKVELNKRNKIQLSEYLSQNKIGEQIIGCKNVNFIYDEFLNINFESKFDMIFIDGNHSLDCVYNDSIRAIKLLNEGGTIIWHDFNNVFDVNEALEKLNLDIYTPINNRNMIAFWRNK